MGSRELQCAENRAPGPESRDLHSDPTSATNCVPWGCPFHSLVSVKGGHWSSWLLGPSSQILSF